jgi:hypothetical protein
VSVPFKPGWLSCYSFFAVCVCVFFSVCVCVGSAGPHVYGHDGR